MASALILKMATEINKNHLQAAEIAPEELDCLFCFKAKDEPLRHAWFKRSRKRSVKNPIADHQPEIEHEASTPNKPMEIKKLKSTGVEIGRGAYGRVFEVKYEKINYAAKEVHPLLLEAAAGQGKALENIKASFLHECQIWSLLKHPRIVEIIGIYYHPKDKFNMPVIIMEKMQFSLTGLVEHRDFSLNQATTILKDVCLGLQYLHNRTLPIVHRDLTPNNILLCCHFRAKITDLGVARTLQATNAKTLTKAPGTPDFMPLECLSDKPVYGLSLDIFSFGGIILYITTKQWPHPAPWINYDPDTDKKSVLSSELQRRQQYLDKMTGNFVIFKPLVQSCLDDNPKKRPTATVVLAKIIEVICKNLYSAYSNILLLHEDERETVETQKLLKQLPHHQQRQDSNQQENHEKQRQQEPKEGQHQSKHKQQEQHEQQQNERQDLKGQQQQLQQRQQKKQDQQNQQEKCEEQHNSQELEQQQKQYEQQEHKKQQQQQSKQLEEQKSYKQLQIQDEHALQSIDRKQLKKTFRTDLTRIAQYTESEVMSYVPPRPSLPDETYPLFMAKCDFFSEKDEFLNFKKGDLLYIIKKEGDLWYGRAQLSDQEGYFPHDRVTDPDSLDAKVWFFGAISRKYTENILMQPFNYSGSFLIRNSESTPGGYSLSVKHINVMKHYKIKNGSKGYHISCSTFFKSIPELVAHYSKSSDGLCINLKKPCLKTNPRSTSSEEATEIWEADRSSIQFTEKLATGQFGEVWQGIWNDTTEVAVKVLMKYIIDTNDFFQEAVVIKQLRHPNIIELYAVCTQEEPIYIITELMKHGSLLEYLKGDGRSLKLPQLIDMGAQVAAGMAYLEENMYVHRDLAARNILVTENFSCKVKVVSMARILSDNTYQAFTEAKCPIKWTSPEAALYKQFTIKSDVWSFGILLFELITYGRPPYPGLDNTEVLEALTTGFCMPRPKGCPEQLYNIMRDCWRDNATTRPTFESLHWRMDNFYVENEPTHLHLHKVQ